MLFSNLVKKFKRDNDDQVTFKDKFSGIEIMRFFADALREMNIDMGVCQKKAYFTLIGNQDTYDLPTDFISSKKLFDCRNVFNMKATKVGDDLYKPGGMPTAYETNDVRKKLYLNMVPNNTWYNTAYRFVFLNTAAAGVTAGSWYLMRGNSTSAFGNWWNAPVVKFVIAAGTTEYVRHSLVEGISLTGTGTVTLNNTLTIASLLGYETNALVGLNITVGGVTTPIVTYTESGSTTVITTGAGLLTNGTGVAYTVETFKKCWISERNLLGLGALTWVLNTTTIYNVDYIMDYVFEHGELWHAQGGTLAGTTTALTLTGTDANLRIGAAIFVPYTTAGRSEDGYTRIITNVVGAAITIDSAFPVTISAATKYYTLDYDLEPQIPQELHPLVSDYAKVFAYKNLNDDAGAAGIEAQIRAKKNKYDEEQAQELADAKNNRNRESRQIDYRGRQL